MKIRFKENMPDISTYKTRTNIELIEGKGLEEST